MTHTPTSTIDGTQKRLIAKAPELLESCHYLFDLAAVHVPLKDLESPQWKTARELLRELESTN